MANKPRSRDLPNANNVSAAVGGSGASISLALTDLAGGVHIVKKFEGIEGLKRARRFYRKFGSELAWLEKEIERGGQ